MKLAESLMLRSDMQKKVSSLKTRLINNAKVQDGEKPAEDPEQLLNELNSVLVELEVIINKINKTNSNTIVEGNMVISDLINKRDILKMKNQILRELINQATLKFDRYSKSEVKIYSTVSISEMQKEIDDISKEYRIVDTKLQSLNWTVDLLD